VDAGYKLIDGDLSIMKHIPLPLSKEAYYNFTETGKSSVLKRNRENIFGRIKSDVRATGKISSETKKMVRRYNKDIEPINKGKKKSEKEVKPITFTSMKNARRRYLKEQKEGKGGGVMEKVERAANAVFGFIGPKEAKAAGIPVADYLDINKVVQKHAKRLGVEPNQARRNLADFLAVVGQAENGGKLKGKNPKSSAKGLYQFVDGSIEPALNRLARTTGWKPWMKELKENKDIEALSWEKQSLLLLGDLFEKTVVVDGKKRPGEGDMYLRDILESGDKEAMRNAYMLMHHTKPDKATEENWNRAISTELG
jgi:hypothetical protein